MTAKLTIAREGSILIVTIIERPEEDYDPDTGELITLREESYYLEPGDKLEDLPYTTYARAGTGPFELEDGKLKKIKT